MSFDLLNNPFAVLGLSPEASIAEVTARAREIGTAEASAASRMLISPRARLPVEIAFLLGTSTQELCNCLDALRAEGHPDMWSLTPAARANVLAHLASAGRASEENLRQLVGLQDAAGASIGELIARSRESARLPPVGQEMLSPALDELRTKHAEAMCAGLASRPDGAELLSELLVSAGTDISPRLMFLKEVASGWERATATHLADLSERTTSLESAIRGKVDPQAVSELSQAIRAWATATKPPRAACRALSLPHQPSVEAIRRWRSLASFLANTQGAVTEAVAVLEAVAEGFGTEDEPGELVRKELEELRRRNRLGEGTLEMRRLLAALEVIDASPFTLQNCRFDDGRVNASTPPAVAELHHAFVGASGVARSSLPWMLIRALSLRLHNELSATSAALGLTLLAIRTATGNKAADEIRSVLAQDERKLRSVLLERELEVALARKQRMRARDLMLRIILLLEDGDTRSKYKAALKRIESELIRKIVGRTVLAGFGLFVLVISHQPSSTPGRGASVTPAYDQGYTAPNPDYARPAQAAQAGTTYSQSAPAALPATPAQASNSDRTETQPVPGTATLSRTELRWCRYRKIAADAAEAWINEKRWVEHDADRFNAAVEAYNAYIQPLNSACDSRQFWVSDNKQIEAEISGSTSTIQSRGTRLVQAAYDSVVPAYAPPQLATPVPAPSPTYYSPPAYSGPHPAQPPPNAFGASAPIESTAYQEGQADRRAWENWIAGLSGSMRDGAEWWASVRSTPRPPSCTEAPGGTDTASAVAGCGQARSKLAASDRRRRTEPNYRRGWNNP